MIFEGFEIDYANVKLIPMLDDKSDLVPETRASVSGDLPELRHSLAWTRGS